MSYLFIEILISKEKETILSHVTIKRKEQKQTETIFDWTIYEFQIIFLHMLEFKLGLILFNVCNIEKTFAFIHSIV